MPLVVVRLSLKPTSNRSVVIHVKFFKPELINARLFAKLTRTKSQLSVSFQLERDHYSDVKFIGKHQQ